MKQTALVKQSIWYSFGMILAMISQFYILSFLTRKVGFYAAGIFSLTITIVNVFQEISFFNIKPFQVVDAYEKYSEEDYVVFRYFTIFVSSVIFIVFLFFSKYEKSLIFSLIIYFLYRHVLIFFDVYSTKFQICNRLDLSGKVSIFETVANICGFLVGYKLGGLIGALILMGFFSASISLFTCFFCYKIVSGKNIKLFKIKKEHFNVIRKLLKVALPLFGYTIVLVLLNALPKTILQNRSGSEMVGIFSTLSTPAVLIPTITNALFAPYIRYFSVLFKNKDIKKLLLGLIFLFIIFFFISLFCSILYYTIGERIFCIVYGNSIKQHYFMFKNIMYSYILYSLNTILLSFFVIIEKRFFAFLNSLVAFILSYPILLYMIKLKQCEGACNSLLFINMFFFMLNIFVLFIQFRKVFCS